MKKLLFLIIVVVAACSSPRSGKENGSAAVYITDEVVTASLDSIRALNQGADPVLLEKGLKHAASLWREADGSSQDFLEFVKSNYISDPEKRSAVFRKIANYFESLGGNFNEISIDLKKILDEAAGEIDEIDRMF